MTSPSNKPRILVVEDEMIIARETKILLTELGYDPVGHATRGEQAISLARELRPDLVLMDMNLAGAMDGLGAAQVIQAELSLPVIFLTAFADGETATRLKLALPLNPILSKPFTEHELQTLLVTALQK